MKKILVATIILLVFAVTAHAQMPQKKGQMPPKQEMMMGQGMMQGMMQEMMHSMKDMMKMQERMITGMSEEDKKAMKQELSRMTEKIDKMMSDMQGMMMKCMMMQQQQQPEPSKGEAPKKPQEHKH